VEIAAKVLQIFYFIHFLTCNIFMIKVGGRWLFGFLSKKERGDSIDKKYLQQVQF